MEGWKNNGFHAEQLVTIDDQADFNESRAYSRAIRRHAKNQRPFKASVGFGRVMRLESDNMNIPIWEKAMLTKQEAALYSHIGINKLEEMLKVPNCHLFYMLERKN